MRLSAAVQKYRDARRGEFQKDTRRNVGTTLRQFVERTGDPFCRVLKPAHVAVWLASIADELSPATIRNRVSTVRVFCHWCVSRGFMPRDPTIDIKGPRQPEMMPRYLTGPEWARLLEVLPDCRAQVITMLALAQGMRRGEIAAQRREDVNLTDGVLLVTRGKGGKQRWLSLNPETADAIRRYYRESLDSTGPLIRRVDHPKRGITREYVSKLMSRWLYEAGVKDHAYDGKSTHALRHTRAGELLEDGATVEQVRDFLGHANLSTVHVYTKRLHAVGALREVAERREYRP